MGKFWFGSHYMADRESDTLSDVCVDDLQPISYQKAFSVFVYRGSVALPASK